MQLDDPLHQGQPDAEAPLRAVEGAVTWVNISNTRRSIPGGMPSPVSAHADHDLAALERGLSSIGPPSGSVLGGVREQVAHHLGEPGRVGGEPDRLARAGRPSGCAPDASMTGRLVSTADSATARSETRSFRR